MLLDFRLNVFITTARTLSFTKTAAILNVSQPAISKHIKELEAEFGEALFERQGGRISLTSKAVEILPLVQNIMEGYSALSDAVAAQHNSFEGALSIGASTTIAQYVLPSILAKFNKQYPRIDISVVSANSDEVIKMLQRKDIEIALIEGDNINSAVHYTEFSDDEIVLVSATPTKKRVRTEDITKIPLIVREEGSGTLSVILSELKSKGISRKDLNIKMHLGSSEAIIRYLKASNTAAFLSILVAQEHIQRRELTINNVEDLRIVRKFRFATLHGQSRRLASLFQSFCEESL